MKTEFPDLTERVAMVTGASRGLGQYFARALACAGADLIITSRNKESLQPFAAEIRHPGRRVEALELDVRSYESIQNMANAAHAAFGKIDILINNAGCNVRKRALDITWDDWNLVLDTNLRGTFFVSQAIANYMSKARYGRIIVTIQLLEAKYRTNVRDSGNSKSLSRSQVWERKKTIIFRESLARKF